MMETGTLPPPLSQDQRNHATLQRNVRLLEQLREQDDWYKQSKIIRISGGPTCKSKYAVRLFMETLRFANRYPRSCGIA